MEATSGSPADADDTGFDAAVDADALLAAVHSGMHRTGMSTSSMLSGRALSRDLLGRDDLSTEQRAAVTLLLAALDRW